MAMKTAAIAIDAWKLPTFKRILEAGGYAVEEAPGMVPGSLTLKVNYTEIPPLRKLIEEAQLACARSKLN